MSSLVDQALIALERSPALLVVLKISFALAIGLTVAALLTRAKASTRHLVLTASFSALLIIPIASFLSVEGLTLAAPANPSSQTEATPSNSEIVGALGSPSITATPSTTATPTTSRSDQRGDVNRTDSAAGSLVHDRATSVDANKAAASSSATRGPNDASQDAAAVATSRGSIISIANILLVAWLAGAGFFLILLGIDLRKLSRVRRRALPTIELDSLVIELSKDAGIGRSIDVLVNEELSSPLTCGMVRPAIVIPTAALQWDQPDLRRALVHELEHVRRNDWSTQLFARVVSSLYWFHPLVWRTWRQLRVEAERAADDAVLRTPSDVSTVRQDSLETAADASATDYADQLVALAKGASASESTGLGMANRSDLAVRVRALLNRDQPRGRQAARTASLALLGAAIALVALAPLRVEASKRSVPTETETTAASIDRTIDSDASSGTSETSPGEPTFKTPNQPSEEPRQPSAGAAPSALDRELIEAASDGQLAVVRQLLDRGANVNAAIATEGSPLIGAARHGHQDVVERLIARGADPNLAVQLDGNALIMAAKSGHRRVVEILLDNGARIDEIVPGDENALISASAAGRIDVVRVLIRRGADVNARVWAPTVSNTGEWRTPIKMARRASHNSIVKILQAEGATE